MLSLMIFCAIAHLPCLLLCFSSQPASPISPVPYFLLILAVVYLPLIFSFVYSISFLLSRALFPSHTSGLPSLCLYVLFFLRSSRQTAFWVRSSPTCSPSYLDILEYTLNSFWQKAELFAADISSCRTNGSVFVKLSLIRPLDSSCFLIYVFGVIHAVLNHCTETQIKKE